MTARRAKQIIYGVLYLIILVGIVAGIRFAFFRPVASCFDGIQDQGETGIDCGGPCAKVCIPADLSVVTVLGEVSVFNPIPQHYTLLAQVANTNSEFGTADLNYQFDLYDASGTLVQSVPGETFIYGGEVKYLVVPNIAANDVIDHAALAIATSTDWAPSSSMGLVPQFGNPLAIMGSTVASSSAAAQGILTVTGRLTDSDPSVFTNILVVAVFYDSYGNPIGASETTLDSIAPNQTENFSVAYPAVPNIDPAFTKAYAYALR